MKKSIIVTLLLAVAVTLTAQNQIQTQVPIRPAGQTDVVGLTVPKMDVVRIGIVGLGMRGPGAVHRLSNIDGTEIVALCDVEPERVKAAQDILKRAGRKAAAEYSGSTEAYKKMCERKDIDLVYICTD